MAEIDGLIWLLLMAGPLLVLQRFLHREIQAVFLLITRRPEIALVLFSLLFFPGVFLHEASHLLMALLLGVRVGGVSLIPRVLPVGTGNVKGSRLQLGFVETANTDFFRDSLIGAAPLITGGLFVTFAGLAYLNLDSLWTGITSQNTGVLAEHVSNLVNLPDFWLWFYLIFAVSSTMLPSASDRKAWATLGVLFVLLLGLAVMIGGGPWMLERLAPPFNQGLKALAAVFAVSVAVHVLLALPVYTIRKLISRATGLQVA